MTKIVLLIIALCQIGGATGAPSTLIGHWKMNEDTASDNDELVTNGDFATWSGDDPTGWSVTGETSPSAHTIDAVNTTNETFTISGEGDLSAWFADGNVFDVAGSTGNDGLWTVSSTAYSDPDFVITVTGDITDATVDGTATPHPDPDISQVGTGEGHGGTGTGMCNIYTSDGTIIEFYQILTLVTGRKYRFAITLDTVTTGSLRVDCGGNTMWVAADHVLNSTGVHTWVAVATKVAESIWVYEHGSGTDITIDDISVKLCAAEDSSGNDHDGLLQEDTSAAHIAGKINGAFDFDGSADFIEVGDTASDVKSIAMWANPDAVNVTDSLIDLNGTDYITIVNGTVTKNGFATGTQIIYVDGAVASTVTTNWHFVVLTSTVGFDADDLDIGREGSNYYDGDMDNVMLFSTTLAAGDVSFLYNSGTGREDWAKPSLFLGVHF